MPRRAPGRMQDNEPLMRALSSLIALNEPDLVLFVGEALVGNDAVDQLTKFNRRLTDLARNQARARAAPVYRVRVYGPPARPQPHAARASALV